MNPHTHTRTRNIHKYTERSPQVAQMPVPQDQTAPVPVRDGQQTLRADQHAVRRRRSGHCAAVGVAADHAADLAARARRRWHGAGQEDAVDVVPGLVPRPRISAEPTADQILMASASVLLFFVSVSP